MQLQKSLSVEEPINEENPVVQFQYRYPFSFQSVASAFITKFNYEPRAMLTTATGVTQIDEDRFMFYRRADTVFSNDITYERVIVDRRDGGKITSELIKPRNGGEKLFERGVIIAENGSALHNHFIYEHQGIKTMKVEAFKIGVQRVLKTIKFAEFEKQE